MTESEIRELVDEWAGLTLKIAAKVKRISKLEKDIKTWLKASPRKEITITGSLATAVKGTKLGDRQMTVTAFIAATLNRTEAEQHGCLKVEMKKAEDLIGKAAVDAIATKPTVLDVSLKLKKV